MAILTALQPDEIDRVLGAFGVDQVEARGVLAGSVNTSFAIVDGQGRRFWLRVYEEQDHIGAAREARLLAKLSGEGVPTPAPLALAGPRSAERRFVATVRDKPVCLFPFVEGNHRCQATVTAADVAAVGAALARVHVVGSRLSRDDALTVPSRFSMRVIRERLAALAIEQLAADVGDAVTFLIARATELEGRPGAPHLPLIHGDLFRDNVLLGDASIGLLDFESASEGSAAFDLMVTLLAWCFGETLDLDLARALVRGYEGVRRLSELEAADLAVEGRVACVRFGATRITDYEARPPGLGVYKDFRRFLARLAWLERVGAELPHLLAVGAS